MEAQSENMKLVTLLYDQLNYPLTHTYNCKIQQKIFLQRGIPQTLNNITYKKITSQ